MTQRGTDNMLAYILALAVGFGSFAIYMAAFFFPEVHRKSDFLWSGVGLFYALILWVCAGRITGAVLLGQMASVALLGWFGWQTLILRRELTPMALQTPLDQLDVLGKPTNLTTGAGSVQIPGRIGGLFGKKKDKTLKQQKPVRSVNVSTAAVAEAPDSVAVTNLEVDESAKQESVSFPEIENPLSAVPRAAEIPVDAVADFTSIPSEPIVEGVKDTGDVPEVKLEITIEATVPESAIATPEIKAQPDSDFFDAEDDFAETLPIKKPSASTPAASKTPKRSGGFGGLLANIKNSLGSLGGFGKGKSKVADATKTSKPPEAKTGIAVPSTSGIDDILESELAEAASEVAASAAISPTAEESQGISFPESVPELADLISATSPTTGETEETARSLREISKVHSPEALTEIVDALEANAATPLVEISEVVFASPAESQELGDISKRLEEGVSTEALKNVAAEFGSVELHKSEEGGEHK